MRKRRKPLQASYLDELRETLREIEQLYGPMPLPPDDDDEPYSDDEIDEYRREYWDDDAWADDDDER